LITSHWKDPTVERERGGGEEERGKWSIVERTICSGEGCSLSITIPLFLLAIYSYNTVNFDLPRSIFVFVASRIARWKREVIKSV